MDSPEMYDLGNNFIKRGAGLARTPPRASGDDGSDSNSPMNHMQAMPPMQMRQYKEAPSSDAVESEGTAQPMVSWPSRADKPSGPKQQPGAAQDAVR